MRTRCLTRRYFLLSILRRRARTKLKRWYKTQKTLILLEILLSYLPICSQIWSLFWTRAWCHRISARLSKVRISEKLSRRRNVSKIKTKSLSQTSFLSRSKRAILRTNRTLKLCCVYQTYQRRYCTTLPKHKESC